MDILVIDNYDSFTYNLVHLLGELGATLKVVRNDKVSVEEIGKIAPGAIVLSPGPCTPNEAGICLDLVRRFHGDIPIFGVCLGLQSIAQAFGGEIVASPTLMHGKISPISHEGTGIFQDIASGFEATRYHSLCVRSAGLPQCLQITAKTADGVIMGLSHKTSPTHGVQFHPESIASEYGCALLQNFMHIARDFNTTRNIAAKG